MTQVHLRSKLIHVSSSATLCGQEFKQFMYITYIFLSTDNFIENYVTSTLILALHPKSMYLWRKDCTSKILSKRLLSSPAQKASLDIFALLYIWMHPRRSVLLDNILEIATLMLLKEILFVWKLPFKLSSGLGVYFPHCFLFQETSSKGLTLLIAVPVLPETKLAFFVLFIRTHSQKPASASIWITHYQQHAAQA